MAANSTREQIVSAADELFYQRGYEHTSFADIAAAVNLSRGNFYYHFKTKDDILAAVIARRLDNTRALLEGWQTETPEPAARIRCFIRILIMNRAKIILYGCPVGTLCSELAKLEHPAQTDAGRLFGLFRQWLAGQFERLGRAADADALAMHLLARSQGIATLASTFRDEDFIRQEVELLDAWLQCQIH
ncbi:TetR/AcrR family transcriptional regulator [Pseudomonas sp. CAU 1711]|uniref:TetR/AcrR family transcriptional regulator n=1 Tax=Pseudomonas sp. CAU 1711 TaxID=3140356 RepID=UPI00326125B7